jgi:hypothetical protein
MKRNKLSQAVTLAIAGAALSAGYLPSASAAATTMYNKAIRTGNNTSGVPNRIAGTDGWVWGSRDDGPSFNWNYPTATNPTGTATPGFVGAGAPTPFGYSGMAHLNWAVRLGNAGDSAEISKADALLRYGPSGTNEINDAEIDTGAGAWQDAGLDSSGNPAPPTGWRHQTDIGLIKSDVTQYVTLNLTRLTAPSTPGLPNDNFGITVYTGMDSGTPGTYGGGNYSHHGGWNCPTCATPRPYNVNNPFGTTGLTYLTHDATVDSVNGLTFTALAGQIYSIYLGGAGVGRWSQNVSDYQLNITTSAIPVPAAAWLFGGALASLIGVNRRKRVLPV